jgi:hypothetical protein
VIVMAALSMLAGVTASMNIAQSSSPPTKILPVGANSSTTQRYQGTAILDRLVSQVTVTDPTHPLFNRTFSVVCLPQHPRTTPVVIIALPNGEHRRIPCSATDLSAQLSSQPPLAPVSACTLLPLANVVRRLLGAPEESLDENRDTSITPADGGLPAGFAPAVAGPNSPSATATGATASRTAAPPPSGTTTHAAKRDR